MATLSTVSAHQAGQYLNRSLRMDDLLTITSKLGVRETMDRFEAAARARNLMIFARVNHAAGAAKAGLSLRPMELLLFGDPGVGTPLMQADARIGIDLPLRALAWEDEDGHTLLATTDPRQLSRRRGIGGAGPDRAVARMTEALTSLMRAAVAQDDATVHLPGP
jgi:uncharacterized protein (DUF302 family)